MRVKSTLDTPKKKLKTLETDGQLLGFNLLKILGPECNGENSVGMRETPDDFR